jgi:multimeric flavodoxin WrbA
MKITIINGSPKVKKSGSANIARALEEKIGSKADVVTCHAAAQSPSEIIPALAQSDAIVLIFPLYVDGIPSHLLRLLDENRADISGAAPEAMLYGVVNNGFFEGKQNHIALEILQNFSLSAGLTWGQGIGVGAGSIAVAAPIGHRLLKNLRRALDTLADNILNRRTDSNQTVAPNCPRFLYNMAARRGWHQYAKKHGMKVKQFYDRP